MKSWKIPNLYIAEVKDGLARSKKGSSIRKKFDNGMVITFLAGRISNVVLPPESSSVSSLSEENEEEKSRFYVVEISPNNMHCCIGSEQIEGGDELTNCSSLDAAESYAREFMSNKQEEAHRFRPKHTSMTYWCSLDEQGIEIYEKDPNDNVELVTELRYDCDHESESGCDNESDSSS